MRRRSALRAALVVGFFWALWLLPLCGTEKRQVPQRPEEAHDECRPECAATTHKLRQRVAAPAGFFAEGHKQESENEPIDDLRPLGPRFGCRHGRPGGEVQS